MEDGPNRFVSVTDLIDVNPQKRDTESLLPTLTLMDFEAIVTGYGGANEVLDWTGDQIINRTETAIADPERRAIGVAA